MTDSTFSQAQPRWPVGLYNTIARVGPRPRPFDAGHWIDRARRRTGLDDFGPGFEPEALELMAGDLNTEARLTPLGRRIMDQSIREALEHRLKITDLHRREGELAAQSIDRPVFIIGGPRTGTTLLQRLMSVVTNARPMYGWEDAYPLPPRRRWLAMRQSRYRRELRIFNYLVPMARTVHPVDPRFPEEELRLLRNMFCTPILSIMAHMPRFQQWLESRPASTYAAAYRFYLQQLRLIQWQRGHGYWVLKSPAHLNGIEGLHEVLPQARVVITHRDLRRVVPSATSLMGTLRRLCSDHVDPKQLGAETLAAARVAFERNLELDQRIDHAYRVDVQFADLTADPIDTARHIHQQLELPLDGPSIDRMRALLEAHPRHKHGVHRYDLHEFGLDVPEFEQLADEYARAFNVPREQA